MSKSIKGEFEVLVHEYTQFPFLSSFFLVALMCNSGNVKKLCNMVKVNLKGEGDDLGSTKPADLCLLLA